MLDMSRSSVIHLPQTNRLSDRDSLEMIQVSKPGSALGRTTIPKRVGDINGAVSDCNASKSPIFVITSDKAQDLCIVF